MRYTREKFPRYLANQVAWIEKFTPYRFLEARSYSSITGTRRIWFCLVRNRFCEQECVPLSVLRDEAIEAGLVRGAPAPRLRCDYLYPL